MLYPQVMKFGGAALRDGAAVRRVCALIAAADRPAVVVSAHHGVTALLERAAREAAEGRLETDAIRVRHRGLLSQLELDPELLNRHFTELFGVLGEVRAKGRLEAGELDFVLSFGERMSARIVAGCLRKLGVAAAPLDAYDLGLVSDSDHGRAKPLPGTGAGLRKSLAEVHGVPVVTGFLARDAQGRLTTLGPNGSDLSAALVAEAVGALELVFYKRVPGIMTADPARVPGARVIAEIGFDEAAELAAHGAEVLHSGSIEPAVRAGFRVRLVDVDAPDNPGTVLSRSESVVGPRALATLEPLFGLWCPLPATAGRADLLARAFELLREEAVEPTIATALGAGFHLYATSAEGVRRIADRLGSSAVIETACSAITAVGRGGALTGSRMLTALEPEGLRPRHAWALERGLSQTVLVDEADSGRALRALHAALFEEREFVH